MSTSGVHKCHRLLRVPPAGCSSGLESDAKEDGARGCPCPESRAMGASAGTTNPPLADRCPPKRSGHAESGCHEGIRERPATGHGQPRAARQPGIPQVENLRPLSENLRPLSENLRPLSENLRPLSESCGHVATGMGSPEPGERARLMRDLSHGRARGTGRRSARADSRPLRCRSPARRGGGPPACRGRGRRPRALRPR
jgi:hypothetical protein